MYCLNKSGNFFKFISFTYNKKIDYCKNFKRFYSFSELLKFKEKKTKINPN